MWHCILWCWNRAGVLERSHPVERRRQSDRAKTRRSRPNAGAATTAVADSVGRRPGAQRVGVTLRNVASTDKYPGADPSGVPGCLGTCGRLIDVCGWGRGLLSWSRPRPLLAGHTLQRPEGLVAALGHWQWQVDALLGQQADLARSSRRRPPGQSEGWPGLPQEVGVSRGVGMRMCWSAP
jgi:hypothetical protein